MALWIEFQPLAIDKLVLLEPGKKVIEEDECLTVVRVNLAPGGHEPIGALVAQKFNQKEERPRLAEGIGRQIIMFRVTAIVLDAKFAIIIILLTETDSFDNRLLLVGKKTRFQKTLLNQRHQDILAFVVQMDPRIKGHQHWYRRLVDKRQEMHLAPFVQNAARENNKMILFTLLKDLSTLDEFGQCCVGIFRMIMRIHLAALIKIIRLIPVHMLAVRQQVQIVLDQMVPDLGLIKKIYNILQHIRDTHPRPRPLHLAAEESHDLLQRRHLSLL